MSIKITEGEQKLMVTVLSKLKVEGNWEEVTEALGHKNIKTTRAVWSAFMKKLKAKGDDAPTTPKKKRKNDDGDEAGTPSKRAKKSNRQEQSGVEDGEKAVKPEPSEDDV